MTDEEKAIIYICNDYYEATTKGLNEKEKAILIEEIKENDKKKIKLYLAGLAEGRKEGYEQGVLKDCLKVACPNCKPSVDNYCINCEYANFIIDKDNQISKLQKENTELKAHCKAIDEVNEKMRCCGNCKNNYSCHYESVDELARIDCGKDLKSWELAE